MGAFLGNLQVWGAAREEVAALLPRALVGQWSEHFVTALDERYGMGTVDRPARKLSKELPEAVVLSVALSDSDLLELAVWQGGKQLTVRAHFPYDGVSKRGNPKKFCQAFRLPPEDERRLKAVWAKGNAEEQLDLTAALLGTPLYADPRMVPEIPVARDEGYVDRWLAEHPDPPKVKNQTRAEEIQTLAGYSVEWRESGRSELRALLCHRPNAEGGHDPKRDVLLCPAPSGYLEEWENFRPLAGLECHVSQSGDRFFVWSQREYHETEMVTSTVWADSDRVLPCPFSFLLDGVSRECCWFVGMEDGGLIADLVSVDAQQRPWEIIVPEELVRYTSAGEVQWRVILQDKTKNRTVEMLHNGLIWLMEDKDWVGIDQLDGRERVRIPRKWDVELMDIPSGEDELWAAKNCVEQESWKVKWWLIRMDLAGNIRQEGELPASLLPKQKNLTFWENYIIFQSFKSGLWLLDRNTLAVRHGIPDHREYVGTVVDRAGRLWVQIGNSTVEAYDRELKLLSRHRLKGEIMAWYLDDHGRLCVVTYSECKGKHDIRFDGAGDFYYPNFDPEKEIVRVYRLS